MTKSMQAALLSALVFPGAGHFLVKRFVTGILLVITTIAALYLIITKVMEKAMMIVEKIQSGAIPIDIEIITELAVKHINTPDARIVNIASIVLLAAWLIGIFDSYRVGRLLEQKKGLEELQLNL